jgi:hypothetical protein
MVIAAQQDEVGEAVPIFIRLRGIESCAARLLRSDVTDFPNNGARVLNDPELASGIRGHWFWCNPIPRQSQ